MATGLQPPSNTATVTQDPQSKPFSNFWFNWLVQLYQVLNFSGLVANQTANKPGLTVTITTAKLTGAGANGSMTFTNGILTAQTQAT